MHALFGGQPDDMHAHTTCQPPLPSRRAATEAAADLQEQLNDFLADELWEEIDASEVQRTCGQFFDTVKRVPRACRVVARAADGRPAVVLYSFDNRSGVDQLPYAVGGELNLFGVTKAGLDVLRVGQPKKWRSKDGVVKVCIPQGHATGQQLFKFQLLVTLGRMLRQLCGAQAGQLLLKDKNGSWMVNKKDIHRQLAAVHATVLAALGLEGDLQRLQELQQVAQRQPQHAAHATAVALEVR
jgi:hypothetical protein